MLVTDPTEAIHSNLIVETFSRYYDLEFFRPVGGMLLYEILFQNEALLSLHGKEFTDLLQDIINEEERILTTNPYSTFFSYFVGKKKQIDKDKITLWLEEENQREKKAMENSGHYYPLTGLQIMTQEFADQKDHCNHLEKENLVYKSSLVIDQNGIPLKRLVRLTLGIVLRRIKNKLIQRLKKLKLLEIFFNS